MHASDCVSRHSSVASFGQPAAYRACLPSLPVLAPWWYGSTGPNRWPFVAMTADADQATRRMHLVREATRVLGSEEKARRWLSEWSPFLAGIPNDLAASSEGFRLVMDELIRIDFGDLT
jgi:hypothetical protein